MHLTILQHVPFEGPGAVLNWAAARGAAVRTVRLYAQDPLPDPRDPGLLVIMGGPMSVNDEAELPWLAAEKRFIGEAIRLGRPVLGICLGAQLIAASLGARVYPAPCKEIGWFPVYAEPCATPLMAFPASLTVLHWHGETFDLPPGAVRLARSDVCENQAFQVGQTVIGLQFHLEMTPQNLEQLLNACGHELVEGPVIQMAEQMRAAGRHQFAACHAQLYHLLDRLAAPCSGQRFPAT